MNVLMCYLSAMLSKTGQGSSVTFSDVTTVYLGREVVYYDCEKKPEH